MTHPDLQALWPAVAADFRSGVGTSRWDEALDAVRVDALVGSTLRIGVPAAVRGMLRDRVLLALGVSASRVLGRRITVVLADGREHDHDRGTRRGHPSTARAGQRGDAARHAPDTPVVERDLHPLYRFDRVVLGEANRLAHAASLAVAEAPGEVYNPLFLCGPPGLGKTHLLHAIGSFVVAHRPGARVRLTSGETFVSEFMAALRQDGMDAFKRRHRQTDVLLVDDVQFLMAKARTEEEFFHTFTVLHDAGAQLVLTCDRSPGALAQMTRRLRERFASGLVAEVEPPDLAMRLTILRKRATLDRVAPVDDAALEAIAHGVTTSVREVEAAFVRAVAHASLRQQPLDEALARRTIEALGHVPAVRPRPGTRGGGGRVDVTVTVEAVIAAVERTFGLAAGSVVGRSATRRAVRARRIAMHVARERTGHSFPLLGTAFARSHTTVMSAHRAIGADRTSDEHLRLDLDRVHGALDAQRPQGAPDPTGDAQDDGAATATSVGDAQDDRDG